MSRARSSFPGESEKPIRRNPHHGREPPTSPRGPVSSCPRGAFGLLLSTCAPVSLVIALLWLVNAILLPQPDRLWQPTSEDGILHRALDASAAMLSQLQRTLGKDHSLASSAQERQKQEQEQTATSPTNSSQQAKAGSVAICLAGGLRFFELTALSLVKHLFASYPGADIFVSAPLTEESHKLLLLREAEAFLSASAAAKGVGSEPWSLKGVHFITQEPIEETKEYKKVLFSLGSPNGLQGVLQYFQLVEGCSPLIAAQEQQQGFMYEWVARARPDSYWIGPAPALNTLNPEAYGYPQGSRFKGLNDRFAIGKRSVAEGGLMRLSVLKGLAAGETRNLRHNSERCLKAQLEYLGIPFQALSLPFCTLSRRPYLLYYGQEFFPTFSLSSTAPANGAKCRPCKPMFTGPEALEKLEQSFPNNSLPYDPPHPVSTGFDLCNATLPWGQGWENILDQDAGDEAASVRKFWTTLSVSDCATKLRGLLQSVPSYTGAGAGTLCRMRSLGPVLDEISSVNTTLSSAKAAFDRMGAAFAQTHVHNATAGELQLPALSLEEMHKCEDCPALVHFSSSTGDMARQQVLLVEMKWKGWELVKCGGRHDAQTCLFLLLRN